MSNKNPSGGIKQYIEPLLKNVAESYFGARARFNSEDKDYIFQNKDFNDDIRKTRVALHIPKLDFDDDFVPIPVNEEDEEYDSIWVNKLKKEQFEVFDKKVHLLLNKYKLPINFRGHIEHYLLYRKKPKHTPLYNFGLITQILQNPGELKRIGLTTSEKKLVKDYLHYEYGESLKTDKGLKKNYKQLLHNLAQSKNKRRQSKTLHTAIKAIKKPNSKRQSTYYDPIKEKDVNPLYTFRNLAYALFKDVTTEKEVLQKAALLRKQKQRLKERYKTSKLNS